MQTDTFSPSLEFRTELLKAEWEPLCKEVLKEFPPQKQRLLCFFDDADPLAMESTHDTLGCHVQIVPDPDNIASNLFATIGRSIYDEYGEFEFDNLIYVPGTAYSKQSISFVLTLAHELRHFVQCCKCRNTISYCIRFERDWSAAGIRKRDFPHERDAMIVSKSVAEKVFTKHEVVAFLKSESENVNSKWQEFWNFHQHLPPGGYNFCRDARQLVKKFSSQARLANAAKGSEAIA